MTRPEHPRPYATAGGGGARVVRLWSPPPDPPKLVAELSGHEALALAVELLQAVGLPVKLAADFEGDPE